MVAVKRTMSSNIAKPAPIWIGSGEAEPGEATTNDKIKKGRKKIGTGVRVKGMKIHPQRLSGIKALAHFQEEMVIGGFGDPQERWIGVTDTGNQMGETIGIIAKIDLAQLLASPGIDETGLCLDQAFEHPDLPCMVLGGADERKSLLKLRRGCRFHGCDSCCRFASSFSKVWQRVAYWRSRRNKRSRNCCQVRSG